MTVTHNTIVEWPVEHRDIFEKFLKGLLAEAGKFRTAKAALGPYVLEMLNEQAAKLEAAKGESGPAFNTRGESQDFIMSLFDNLKHLEKRAESYKALLDAPDGQLEALHDKEKQAWLSGTGWVMLEHVWNLRNVAKSYHAKLPARSRALRAVVILAMDAIRTTPSTDVLQFALQSVWLGFWNYYTDYRRIIDTHGPLFLEAMKPIQRALELIEEGMAESAARAEAQRLADEAAARRAAEEAEEEERRARWAAEEEEEQQARWAAGDQPQQQCSSDDDDDSYSYRNSSTTYDSFDANDYWSNHNPANGMPTTSPYGFDVMGNTYGFNE